MEQLPIFVKLDGQPCLVVGGGVVAERKAALLQRAGARVKVIAPSLTGTLRAAADRGEIDYAEARYERIRLRGFRLVIAATDEPDVNRHVARRALEQGVLCNVVDDLDASSFILPAIVDRSPVLVAVGTGGNAPVLAQRLKSALEAWLPTRIGELALAAGRWRRLVTRRFTTTRQRRRFWQGIFDGPVASHLLAGRAREAERQFRRALLGATGRERGEAWIVGAGPGDPGLVTIRAQQLIGAADVVLYDRLVSAPVLDFARKEAELIPVGKQAGRKLMGQEEINRTIVRLVRQGKRVCRLKGGDPFVFGRGGEEALAVAAAGLPFQVVPGISAALGCAAYAGIPLTHRGKSASVTLATASLDRGDAADWQTLAGSGDTLVLYMSVGALGDAARELAARGLAPQTPAAVIENGTTSEQRVVRATLSSVAEAAREAQIRSPALVFIGETAAMASQLGWFDGRSAAPAFDDLPGPRPALAASA